jgi:hypothetical protein
LKVTNGVALDAAILKAVNAFSGSVPTKISKVRWVTEWSSADLRAEASAAAIPARAALSDDVDASNGEVNETSLASL